MKFHVKFPDGRPPVGIYGYFGGQQFLEGFVGICMELHCVHQGSDALRYRGHHNGRCWWGCPLGMSLLSLCSPEMKYLPAEVAPLAGERES